jgi:integrase
MERKTRDCSCQFECDPYTECHIRIDFTTPSGERFRRSADTSSKAQAQEFHDQPKIESWRVSKLGDRPKYTWDDAGYKWLQETAYKRPHHGDMLKLAWLQQFLRGRVLAEITGDEIAAIGECKKAAASGPTANRFLALIRAILRRACYEWEWIDRVPKVKMYKESKRRLRWITPEQGKTLLAELPPHQHDIVLFALATGLRQSNVTGLKWAQIDLQRRTGRVAAEEAKGGEDIHLSLSDLAIDVLTRQLGKHDVYVFTFRGMPVRHVNITKAWRHALQRAGIENFRWHDLRHTWVSWLVQNGTRLYDLQEMGGWKSAEMVGRYAHLAPAQMAKHAAVISALMQDTNTAQGG